MTHEITTKKKKSFKNHTHGIFKGVIEEIEEYTKKNLEENENENIAIKIYGTCDDVEGWEGDSRERGFMYTYC